MFCGLGIDFELEIRKSVQKLGRKKRKKPHRGQKWVGWDERVS